MILSWENYYTYPLIVLLSLNDYFNKHMNNTQVVYLSMLFLK